MRSITTAPFSGEPDDYVTYVLEQAMPHFERTMHYVTNILIDITDDIAHVQTYLLAVHLRANAAVETWSGSADAMSTASSAGPAVGGSPTLGPARMG
jgi:hypothetical protein